ncbi:MAG TPA: hypothetical protein VGN95_11390 [Pyrinomonadaceae bacterium]|jgi:hypothetical protein|nr:hypothetical protein [Pyrinomonadaceae bacterium]
MKATPRTLLCVGILILLAAWPIIAQENQSKDTDDLKMKIEQMEKIDLTSKSATTQDIYKRSLLRLYNQYVVALRQDIEALKEIQSTAGETSSETRNEVALQLQKLRAEQSITNEKIQTLSGDLQTASTASSRTPTSAPEVVTPNPQIKPVTYTIPESRTSYVKPTAKSSSLESLPTSDTLSPQDAVLPVPTLDSPIKAGATVVKGKSDLENAEIVLMVNGSHVEPVAGSYKQVYPEKTFEIRLPNALAKDDTVRAAQIVGGVTSRYSAPVTVVDAGKAAEQKATAEAEANNIARGPFGVLVGGSVISNQSQSFSQADPFFGFVAGYTSNNKIIKSQKRDDKGNVIQDQFNSKDWGTFNLRFEGLFNSSARTAKAPPATTTATTGGTTVRTAAAAAATTADLPFLASRKTFETGLQLWWEFPVPGSKFLTIGPYAAYGTSSVLDKNELKDEDVRVGNNGNTGGSDIKLDTSQVKTDNDLKRYFEYGFMMNIFLGNRGQFIHSTFARGNFEALEGLYKDPITGLDNYNTKKRFHGRLDIFPLGLARGFGKQVKMTPMFGVDLNASRGPDSLRFFSGFAVSLKAPKTGQDNPLGKDEDSDTTKDATKK